MILPPSHRKMAAAHERTRRAPTSGDPLEVMNAFAAQAELESQYHGYMAVVSRVMRDIFTFLGGTWLMSLLFVLTVDKGPVILGVGPGVLVVTMMVVSLLIRTYESRHRCILDNLVPIHQHG